MVRIALFMCFLAAMPAFGSAAAPTGPADAANATMDALPDAEIKALVETLEDEAARKQLVGQLNALLAARRQLEGQGANDRRVGAKFIDVVSESLSEFGDKLVSGSDAFVDIPAAIS